jgi:type I restriction enzyme S subunit
MTAVFLEEDWSPYLNSFCFGLRVESPSSIDPLFAKYVLRGDKFREDMRPLAQGSTRFNLSKGNLAKLNLLLPPLPEQKKIASILTSVDEVIENTQKQIDKLQDLKKATMNELLTKGIGHTEFKDSELGRIPKSWEVRRLGDILAEKPSYGANASATNKDFATVRYIRITDINEYGQLRSDSTAFIKDSDADGYFLANDDLLIARTGNTVGKPYLHESNKCDSSKRFAYAGYLILFRFNKERARPKYIFQYTLSKFFKDWIQENSRVGAQPNINAQEYSSFVLPLPSLKEQDSIVSILLSIDGQKQSLNKKLSQTQSLKKSLMQDLLTGKVRVTVN